MLNNSCNPFIGKSNSEVKTMFADSNFKIPGTNKTVGQVGGF